MSTHFSPVLGIQIKEEPDSEEWQLSGDSTLNPSDLNNLRVQMGDEDMETPSGEGKRLRRVACTCPNCKESGGRWAPENTRTTDSDSWMCRFLAPPCPTEQQERCRKICTDPQ